MRVTHTLKRRIPQVDFKDQQISRVLARVLANRGVSSVSELKHSLKDIHRPDQLSGISQACELLHTALQQQLHIMIVGDFDADGATSTAVMMRGLAMLGFKHVSYQVPNRFEYGYGLTPEIVDLVALQKPDLIITVDNGVASHAGVHHARSLGIKVLVTDHHLPGDTLPAADAMVNPNLNNDPFPSKNLAGVGVAFYLLVAFRAFLRQQKYYQQQPEPDIASLLDLVALGTVADVVPLDSNNRILVEQGLRRMRQGQCCEGIKALFTVAKRNLRKLNASDLGFVAGPRLNAAGRLNDMSLGIECLLADSASRAYELAELLNEMNLERRALETTMRAEAKQMMQGLMDSIDAEAVKASICLYDSQWHQGIVGLLASRIKDQFQRPAIAFAPVSDTEVKGSARSVPGVHIRDVLDAVAKKAPDILSRFGGHAMAAGLSLHPDHLSTFEALFEAEVQRISQVTVGQCTILSDGELQHNEINITTAELLDRSGPWGQGFPEPVFDGVFNVVEHRVVGKNHLKLIVACSDQPEAEYDAIAFNQNQDVLNRTGKHVKLVYQLDINEFRGRRTAQLLVRHILPATALC